jgi:hypothetical protein
MEVLPTKDEQLALSNAQALLRSNLLNLQVTELISTVKTSDSATKKIEDWLHHLFDAINSSNDFATKKTLTEEFLINNRMDSFALRNYDPRKTISLEPFKPSSINIVGSFALGTLTSPFVNCDIAVGFPDQSLEERWATYWF